MRQEIVFLEEMALFYASNGKQKKKERRQFWCLLPFTKTVLVDTGKKDKNNIPIEKPEAVYYYCSKNGRIGFERSAFELLCLFMEKCQSGHVSSLYIYLIFVF